MKSKHRASPLADENEDAICSSKAMFVPPSGFGIAEAGIYRCSKVETLNLSFLEVLNLRTVLFVGGQEPSQYFKQFFNKNRVKWVWLRTTDFLLSGSSGKRYSDKSDALPGTTTVRTPFDENSTKKSDTEFGKRANKFARSDNYYYHLNDDDQLMLIKSECLKEVFDYLLNVNHFNVLLVDKTGLIIGVLRKIQKWSIASIINEYRLYMGKNRNYFAETFLEMIEVTVKQDSDSYLNKTNGEKNFSSRSPHNHRRLSKMITVNENSLCDSPEIPQRMLEVVRLTESKKGTLDSQGLLSDEMRTSSNLGIFGNRYRLAFDRKENGDYEYYKCSNRKRQEDAVILHLPIEEKLPAWFKYQRDLWERENVADEHHFYKEHIYT